MEYELEPESNQELKYEEKSQSFVRFESVKPKLIESDGICFRSGLISELGTGYEDLMM